MLIDAILVKHAVQSKRVAGMFPSVAADFISGPLLALVLPHSDILGLKGVMTWGSISPGLNLTYCF